MIQRRPGEWPVNQPADLDDVDQADATEDDLYVKRVAELARRELVLGSIRAHLEEQPTPNSVLAASRAWCADVTAIGDKVAKAKRSTR